MHVAECVSFVDCASEDIVIDVQSHFDVKDRACELRYCRLMVQFQPVVGDREMNIKGSCETMLLDPTAIISYLESFLFSPFLYFECSSYQHKQLPTRKNSSKMVAINKLIALAPFLIVALAAPLNGLRDPGESKHTNVTVI